MPDSPIGAIAARTLTSELRRHAGPKTVLLLGVDTGSAVLAEALDALLPDDRLTVVLPGGRAHIESHGPWVADRVHVVDSIAEAEPVDVIVQAAPDPDIDELAKLLNPGGLLVVAMPAWRKAPESAVGSDLVLRNIPPLRTYRLRFSAAETATVTRLRPGFRPSSVRLTRRMHIDSNGVAAAGLALGLAGLLRAARSRWWPVPALAAVPVAAFFRDPERDVPEDESAVVAASDGRVLAVEHLTDARFGTDEFLRIAVFLSVLDVHVNRSPVAGRVVDVVRTDGGYAPAMNAAAEHNVAAYTVLDTPRGTVVVAQRTGLIARRIVHRAPVGSLLARSERFGLIRFGSRTDVYLPAAAAEPTVAPGDRVLGGETVIARWRT